MNNHKKLFIAIISLSLSGLWACGPTPQDAKEYKEKITSLHKAVVKSGDSIESAFASLDTIKIEKALKNADVISSKAISELKKLTPISRDSLLYKKTGNFFMTFRKVLNDEYKEKFSLYCIPDEQFNLENEKQIEKIDIARKEKLKTAAKKLEDAEFEFAERYNLKIIK